MKKIVDWVNGLWVEKRIQKDYLEEEAAILGKLNNCCNFVSFFNSGLKGGTPKIIFTLIDYKTIQVLQSLGFKHELNSFCYFLEDRKSEAELLELWREFSSKI